TGLGCPAESFDTPLRIAPPDRVATRPVKARALESLENAQKAKELAGARWQGLGQTGPSFLRPVEEDDRVTPFCQESTGGRTRGTPPHPRQLDIVSRHLVYT